MPDITTIKGNLFLGEDKTLRFRVLLAKGQVKTGATTTLVPTDLPSITDDEYNTKYAMFLDGSNRGKIIQISDYAALDSKLTFGVALAAVPNISNRVAVLENLTGYAISFSVYKFRGDDSPIFTKTVGSGITLTAPTSGLLSVAIAAADTTSLEPRGYWYELKRTDAGFSTVFAQGDIIFGVRPAAARVAVYATAGELQAYLRVDHKSVRLDVMSRLLEAASREIDNITGRNFFQSASIARYFPGNFSSELDIGDCISISTVKVDEDDDGVYELTIAATDYVTHPYNADPLEPPISSIELRPTASRSTWHGYGPKMVEVTGVWGFCQDTNVPAPISQACIMQAGRWYKRAETAFSSMSANQQFGQFEIYKGMDPDVEQLLKDYKRLNIGYM